MAAPADAAATWRRKGLLAGLALLIGGWLTGPLAGPAHAASRDGWCKQDEGLAVVIDFSSLSAKHWPNSKGYLVRCIVSPSVSGTMPAAVLQAAGIEHTSGGAYVDSILGLAAGNQTFGWVCGRNRPGTLSWEGITDKVALPDPQTNGFSYCYAKSSSNDPNSLPAVLPQFAPSGEGGGGGGGDGGSLVPGAPQQPGGGGGGGDQLNPEAPVQPGQPGQPGGANAQTGDNLNPGAPSQTPIAPDAPNASAIPAASQTSTSAPTDPADATSPPMVFSSEQPQANQGAGAISQAGTWWWAAGGLAVAALGAGAGFGVRKFTRRIPEPPAGDGD